MGYPTKIKPVMGGFHFWYMYPPNIDFVYNHHFSLLPPYPSIQEVTRGWITQILEFIKSSFFVVVHIAERLVYNDTLITFLSMVTSTQKC